MPRALLEHCPKHVASMLTTPPHHWRGWLKPESRSHSFAE
jgi:hypothetical protein